MELLQVFIENTLALSHSYCEEKEFPLLQLVTVFLCPLLCISAESLGFSILQPSSWWRAM